MTTYSVRLETMQSTLAQAQTYSAGITKMLSDLETDLNKTLSGWTGDAQTAYATQQANWNSAAQQMPAALAAAAQTLESISGTYGGADRAVRQTFHG